MYLFIVLIIKNNNYLTVGDTCINIFLIKSHCMDSLLGCRGTYWNSLVSLNDRHFSKNLERVKTKVIVIITNLQLFKKNWY